MDGRTHAEKHGRLLVAAAAIGLSLGLIAACQADGGSFVGAEADPRSGELCGLCLDEVDPGPVDCAAAEAGLEFLPVTIWDFDDAKARNMYVYYDGSPASAKRGAPLLRDESLSWQPRTEPARRCKGDESNSALHIQYGPFTNWGGGVGRHFKCLNGARSDYTGEVKVGTKPGTIDRACDATDAIRACTVSSNAVNAREGELARSSCPQRDQDFRQEGELTSVPPEEEFMLGMTLDLSEWDGLSFWARRANDSQPGIRLGLGDKYTDDDLSFLQYHINPDARRFCERNVDCGCPGNGVCSYKKREAPEDGPGDGTDRCWDSPRRTSYKDEREENPSKGENEQFRPCGQRTCDDDNAAMQHPDEQTANTTCQPYISRGGREEAICYNPEEGPLPVDNPNKCGDHWVAPIRLSTEWELYKVPFDTLLQQGWAKESFQLDLTSAAVVRFTWGTGWLDMWIDDVRVYRDLHNTTEN